MSYKKSIKLLLVIFSLMSISCTNSISKLMLRNYSDPEDSIINIQSFKKAYTIYLDWEEDECADYYILNRAENMISAGKYDFHPIYEGQLTHYEDTDLNPNQTYVYQLVKMRGKVDFKGTHYAYGVCSPIVQDEYEPNDNKENAIWLNMDCLCNTYYARFGDAYIKDEDWFYIDLPARRQATISVDTQYGSQECLQWHLDTQTPSDISNGKVFFIENETNEPKRMYFNISINPIGLRGFTSVNYTISLLEIVKYNR